MANNSLIPTRKGDARIYVMATACTVVLVSSVVIPRLARNPDGDFAAATTAAVAFLGLALLAACAALALLVYTLKRRRMLSLPARIVGFVPAGIVALGLFALWVFVLQ